MSYNIDLTVDAICAQLGALVISELDAMAVGLRQLTNKDKLKNEYVSIDCAKSLLCRLSKDVVKEILSIHINHKQETDEKIDNLTKSLELTNNSISIFKKELVETKLDMDRNNQFNRREMIRLHNVEEPKLSPGEFEDVHKTVLNVMKEAGIEVEPEMISSAQRLSGKKTDGNIHNKPITFKLTRRFDRNRILRQKKKQMKENASFQIKYPKVFMTEDLTPLRQHMAFKLRKDDNIAISWSINGMLKCLKKDFKKEDKPYTINVPADLGQIGWSKEDIAKFIEDNLIKTKE